MKSLLTCLVGVFAIAFITSCSTLNDEDITPDQSKDKLEKFDVKMNKGGQGDDNGDPEPIG